MSNIRITTDIVTVRADFLKHTLQLALVDVPNTKPDEKYVRCIATNTQLHRLLVEDRFVTFFGSRDAALRKTDILQTLKALKDDEWKRLVKEGCGHSTVAERYTRGQKRTKVLAFDTTVPIVTPQVSTIESVTLIVECSKPGVGLVMLLTPEALEYLRNAVTAQLDAGGMVSTRSHVRSNLSVVDRVDTDVPNLYWSYSKNKFRAIHVSKKKGGRKQEFLTESKDLAMTFVKTGVRPRKTRGSKHARGCRCSTCRYHKKDTTSPEPSEAGDEDEASSSGSDDRAPADNV